MDINGGFGQTLYVRIYRRDTCRSPATFLLGYSCAEFFFGLKRRALFDFSLEIGFGTNRQIIPPAEKFLPASVLLPAPLLWTFPFRNAQGGPVVPSCPSWANKPSQ